MEALAHHALLGASVLALAAAGLRAAAGLSTDPVARALVAAVLAVAVAVLTALGLGLAGLGGSAVALAAVAGLTWLAARRAWPEAPPPVRLGLPAAAALGLSAAWVVSIVRLPVLRADALTYHLADVAAWAADGTPGSREPGIYGVPVEAYPKTWEVTVGWAASLAGSSTAAAPLMLAVPALIAGGIWLALRAFDATPLVAGLAALVAATLPPVLAQLGGPNTDAPALGFLCAAGGLAAAATRGRPVLLAPAVVAAGLALGTKTTTGPLAVTILLAAALSLGRRRLPVKPLLVAAVVALLTGGVWFARNLVLHGSPLWPFVALPGGDPLPPLFSELGVSFLERPAASLDGRGGDYLRALGGAAAVLVALPVLAALDRGRTVLVTGLLAAAALLIWSLAPFTGASGVPEVDAGLAGAVRYGLPTLATAIVAAGLARRRPRLAAAVLGVALVLNLLSFADLAPPDRPRLWVLAAGAALGALALPLLRRPAVPLALGLTALGVAAPGYWQRHADAGLADAGALRFLAAQPGYAGTAASVAMAPVRFASFAGDGFEHRVTLIGQAESCARLAERRRGGAWVVLYVAPQPAAFAQPATAPGCLAGERPAFADGAMEVYAPR